MYALNGSLLGKWFGAHTSKKKESAMKAHLPQLPSTLALLPHFIQNYPNNLAHPLHKS